MLEGVITFLQLFQALLAGLGLFIAIYIFRKKRTGQKLVCPVGADCDSVVHSPFSKFLGVPVEAMGILYYVLILVGYGGFLVFPSIYRPETFFILFLMTVVGFLFSLYLTFIQMFTLHQFCTWCLFSAAISSGIFIIGLYTLGTYQGGLITFLELLRPGIILIHGIGAALGLGAATIADVFFFNFLKDFKISHKENQVLHTLSQVIWLALGILVLTGIGIYLPKMAVYNLSSKFLLKSLIVLIIIVNGSVLNLFVAPLLTSISFGQRHHHYAGELSFIRRVAFALGAISLISWYAVFILGSVRSIPLGLIEGFCIYAGIVAMAIIGSQVMERIFTRRGAAYIGPVESDE